MIAVKFAAMPTWDAEQYLRFKDERTRPCRELCGARRRGRTPSCD